MEESNKKTLIEALSTLREYDPPESIWERIDMQVELGTDKVVPVNTLHDLPEYDPPAKVWQSISKQLKDDSTAKIVKINWRRPLAIAASLAVLLAMYFGLQNELNQRPETEEFAVSYSVEQFDEAAFANDWDQDNEAFEQYHVLCEAKSYVCEHAEFKVLQQEFEELSSAISELETAMGAYGANADLVGQIKDIELERTDIFKKMMVMLI